MRNALLIALFADPAPIHGPRIGFYLLYRVHISPLLHLLEIKLSCQIQPPTRAADEGFRLTWFKLLQHWSMRIPLNLFPITTSRILEPKDPSSRLHWNHQNPYHHDDRRIPGTYLSSPQMCSTLLCQPPPDDSTSRHFLFKLAHPCPVGRAREV